MTDAVIPATPIRMLAVDDSEDDYAFALRLLDRAGYDVNFSRISHPWPAPSRPGRV